MTAFIKMTGRLFAPESIDPAIVSRYMARHAPGTLDPALRQLVTWAFQGRIAGLSEHLSQPERHEERAAMRAAFKLFGLLDDRDVQ